MEGIAKLEALIRGVLIGNIFDWGAQEVAALMESTNFCFEDAEEKIPGSFNIHFFSEPKNLLKIYLVFELLISIMFILLHEN